MGNKLKQGPAFFACEFCEAAAGKNINHPGKLYQILAQIIAQEVSEIEKVKECYVQLLSEIGKPLDEPQIAAINIITDADEQEKEFESIKEKAKNVAEKVLNNLGQLQKEIALGKYKVY